MHNIYAHSSKQPVFCFVALRAYNVFAKDADNKHIGGAEVQQAHIARGLRDKGYKVKVITYDHGQKDSTRVDGIEIIKAHKNNSGISGLKLFHPMMTGLWSALNRASADIVYQRSIEIETGIVAQWCKSHRRKFIFSIAHDSNCTPELPTRSWIEKPFCRYGFQHADIVIAQTIQQQKLVSQNWGRETRLIRSCAADPLAVESMQFNVVHPAQSDSSYENRYRKKLLWVGRISKVKAIERLIDAAKKLPDVEFDIVGKANSNSAYSEKMLDELLAIRNIKYHGFVPAHEMGKYYDESTALLCTSKAEGFPNTFLEAWSRGRAVITTLDPDELVENNQLGTTCYDPDNLHITIDEFLSKPNLVVACGRRARQYFLQNHTIDHAVKNYHDVVQNMYILNQMESISSSNTILKQEMVTR